MSRFPGLHSYKFELGNKRFECLEKKSANKLWLTGTPNHSTTLDVNAPQAKRPDTCWSLRKSAETVQRYTPTAHQPKLKK